MLAQDFELYYYSDSGMAEVRTHSHDYYEFYFFLEGDVCMKIGERSYLLKVRRYHPDSASDSALCDHPEST